MDPADCQKHRYNQFSSIMLNNQESHFSQLKLEFYGLYHMLSALCLYVIGIWNLIVKVDACYIKGMLQSPDIQPTASLN
ncbi:hypothetical protein DXG03_005982 [Asterophora parasitica]|uniref:Uncharacterized protein n=1 Tax=Asterophora parasitica TaxID=117018 RepID=A0A9P7G178_9AGAR|nr:hypothetical protein DXG03_005982 [Asterophora parasitica]